MTPGFLRKILTLGSGIAAGQGLLLLATPLLSRIYSPADFGLFGLLVALASILAVGSNGRYFLALVQPRSDSTAAALLGLCLVLTLGFGVLCSVLLWLLRSPLVAVLNNPGFAAWWWWVPLAGSLAGWFDALNYWHIRRERFGLVARIQPARSLVLIGLQVGLGAAGTGFPGLASGRLAADAFLCVSLVPALWTDLVPLRAWRRPLRWLAVARRYRDFPLFSAPQGWLSAVSQYLPILVLAWLLDDVVVGIFLMTHRILATPNMFLGKALRQVFYQQLHGDDRRPGDRHALWRQITRSLLLWGATPVLITVLCAPLVFPLVLGQEWQLAGRFAQAVVVWQFVAIVAIPSHMLLMASGKQRWHLGVELVFLAVRFVALWIGASVGGAMGSVVAFSAASALMQAILILLAARAVEQPSPEVERG